MATGPSPFSAASPDDWWFPKVYSVSPVVYWEGANSVSSSRMQYFGNCVKQEFDITIIAVEEQERDDSPALNRAG